MCSLSRYLLVGGLSGMAVATVSGSELVGWSAAAVVVGLGTVALVGCDPDRIVSEATELLENPAAYEAMACRTNPYGDGRAAERIVNAVLGLPVEEFDPAPPPGAAANSSRRHPS